VSHPFRTALVVVFLALVLAAPPASASRTYKTFISSMTSGIPTPGVDADAATVTVPITVGPGYRIVADLVYQDLSGVGADDLDLTLYSPFYTPVDVAGPALGGDVAGESTVLSHYADQRVGRTTCTSATAESHTHLGAAKEHIEKTLPAGAETGTYQLTVTAFLLADAYAPLTLTVTVLSPWGADVSATATGAAVHGAVTNAYAYCDTGATDQH
jgi:hypothetical protein